MQHGKQIYTQQDLWMSGDISRTTLQDWLKKGLIPRADVQIGRLRVYSREQYQAALKAIMDRPLYKRDPKPAAEKEGEN